VGRKPTLLLVTAGIMVAVLALGGAAWAQAAGADLAVTKTVKPKVVAVGDNQTFTVKVTNQRGIRAKGVELTDDLPDEVRFVRASTSRHRPGSCDAQAGTVTCNLGRLGEDKSVTVKIVVRNVEAGRYVNRATVEHRTDELQASDNQDGARGRGTRN
jgi:uncharacterized repeat protein (TIGR01451 family)